MRRYIISKENISEECRSKIKNCITITVASLTINEWNSDVRTSV